jgi:serine protease Do
MHKKLLVTTSLIILVIFSLSLLSCNQEPVATTTSTTPVVGTTSSSSVQQPLLPTVSEVVAKVKPSVVAINVEITTYNFFNQPSTGEGAGAGWIISEDGYIVTNNHVVDGATNVTVTLDDGRSFSADKIYTDPFTDLAVIKIDAQNLPALSTGDSSKLSIGDWVTAIGNALGQGISATTGVVSAMNISVSESPGQTLHDLIQTDAAINPGNSGGPLVNMAGEVVGITSIKVSEVGVEGMGYAISINEAMPIINTLMTTGYVVRPYLGISVYTVDQSLAAFYNLGLDKGVLITDVASGSPADKAGLRPGDIITAVDGKEQVNDGALIDYINSLKIGQEIEITYYRGNATNTVSITLVESPKS